MRLSEPAPGRRADSLPSNDVEKPDSLTEERLSEISGFSAERLDSLPFGAIKLDRDGTVLSYNLTESKLTGRDPQQCIGRNFFRDVAPCTNVKLFAGRYREGIERGDLHESFRYLFNFRMAPMPVVVTLFFHETSGCGWVFVRALGDVR